MAEKRINGWLITTMDRIHHFLLVLAFSAIALPVHTMRKAIDMICNSTAPNLNQLPAPSDLYDQMKCSI